MLGVGVEALSTTPALVCRHVMSLGIVYGGGRHSRFLRNQTRAMDFFVQMLFHTQLEGCGRVTTFKVTYCTVVQVTHFEEL